MALRKNTPITLADVKLFSNFELLAKQTVEGFITGLHRSPYHGFSVEFAEHKLYNPGDGTRHIDWKAYAKTDKLYVKRYEEETNLRCTILIDVSSSMYYPAENNGKILFSAWAAAAIACLLQKQRDAVGLCTFSNEINYQSQVKSTSIHLHAIMKQLSQLANDQSRMHQATAVAEVLHHIANQSHRRSLIVLFSDMFENIEHHDAIFSALQHLKHNHHEVLLFHVFDKKTEQEFEFQQRPYVFTDLETGDKVKLLPHEYKEKYTQTISAYYKELKDKCGAYKIDFIEADINEPAENVLLQFFIKRASMR
ncbi:MAG: hypothetical protein RIQ70_1085 [Bacteroidota bacterium]